MAKVKFRIKEVKIILSAWNDRRKDNLHGSELSSLITLPSTTEYEKSWMFQFECGACQEIIRYDNDYKHSDTALDVLFEPYYSKEALQNIASLFENIKVFSSIEEPDKHYLTHLSYNDRSASPLLIPNVRLRHNICPSCNTQLLYWMNDEPPRPPSREYHAGAPGFLRINEIIGLDVDDGVNFVELLQ